MAKKRASGGAGVPVKELSEAVAFVRGFCSSDKVSTDDIGLRALHFNGDVVRAMSRVGGAERRLSVAAGEFAVAGDRLATALSAVESQGVAEVELTVDGKSLAWRGGSARGRIPLVESPIEFPDVPEFGEPLDVAEWLAVQRVQYALGRSEQYPMLRGVYWDCAVAMASDGDRLARVRAHETPDGVGVLVPDHLLRALRGFTPAAASLERENEVWLRDESATVFGRLYQAEFPARRMEQVFEQFAASAEKREWCRVAPKEGQPVRALLKSVGDAALAPARAVRVVVGKRALEVSCESEGGEARVVVAADVDGPAAECSVNAHYLAELFDQGAPLYFGGRCVYVATDDGKFQAAAMCFAS